MVISQIPSCETRLGQTKQRNEKAFIMLKKLHQVLHFCACVLSVLQCRVQVFLCVCVFECYAVLHLPMVEMEGDMAGCSLSKEGEC